MPVSALALDLAPLLADIGARDGELAPVGGGPAANLVLETDAGARGSPAPPLDAIHRELSAGGALLVALPGDPPETELAAWRNALWPLLHAIAVYRFDGRSIARRTLGGVETVGDTSARGSVLALRRRAFLMSPAATVEKFDLNAAGWDGEPGGPGYPHFRWMRRHVGLFARPPAGARILDVGCGAGWCGIEAAMRAPGSRLCACDPSPAMVELAAANAAREGVRDFTGRTGFGEDPPFPAAGEPPFDLVISSGVVSFSPDPERWLDGVARTVAPGGTLVVGDIHHDSLGFARRRRSRALLPVRELNARTRAEIRRGLEARGFVHERSASYQLTWPVPQTMHLNETRLRGALTWPLLWANRAAAACDRALGSPLPDLFDSWVTRLSRRR